MRVRVARLLLLEALLSLREKQKPLVVVFCCDSSGFRLALAAAEATSTSSFVLNDSVKLVNLFEAIVSMLSSQPRFLPRPMLLGKAYLHPTAPPIAKSRKRRRWVRGCSLNCAQLNLNCCQDSCNIVSGARGFGCATSRASVQSESWSSHVLGFRLVVQTHESQDGLQKRREFSCVLHVVSHRPFASMSHAVPHQLS